MNKYTQEGTDNRWNSEIPHITSQLLAGPSWISLIVILLFFVVVLAVFFRFVPSDI